MKSLHQIAAALCLAIAILVSAPVSAGAKSNDARARSLTGVIISIDRDARTMLVREIGSNQTYRVQVPAGRTVTTRHQTRASAHFEHLLVGMIVTDLYVQ